MATAARGARQRPLGAILVICALGVAELTHEGLSALRLRHAVLMAPAAAPALQPSSAVNIARVIVAHLFGKASTRAALGDPRDAPDAGGTFALSGVIATADPKVGSAILGRKGQATRLYQAGALLVGLASGRLYEVYEDRVILELDGRFQTLRLPHSSGGFGSVLVATQSDSSPSDLPEQPDAPGVPETPIQMVSLARSLFENLNPAPRFAGGRFGGLRLNPTSDDQQRFGVHNGDLVVAVNGVKLTSANSVNALLTDQDDQHATVSLTVLRNGTQQVIEMTDSN